MTLASDGELLRSKGSDGEGGKNDEAYALGSVGGGSPDKKGEKVKI